MSKRAALYLRVSTTEQTTENQQRELEAIAERHEWRIVAVFKDHGISGAKGRDKRPGFHALCEGVTRREFDKVVAWSLDRLSRKAQELLQLSKELDAKGIGLYVHTFLGQSMDTGTPGGRLLFTVVAGIAEFERDIIVERVRAGIARARAESPQERARKKKKPFGRPNFAKENPMLVAEIRRRAKEGQSWRKIAGEMKRAHKLKRLSHSTVGKVLASSPSDAST